MSHISRSNHKLDLYKKCNEGIKAFSAITHFKKNRKFKKLGLDLNE